MHHTTNEERIATFHLLVRELDALGIAWMQIAQYNAYGDPKFDGIPQGIVDLDVVEEYRSDIKHSNLITNTGYTPESAEKLIADGKVVAVVFGRSFIANPDLFRRAEEGVELAQPDFMTFYGPKDGVLGHGYWDYAFADGSIHG